MSIAVPSPAAQGACYCGQVRLQLSAAPKSMIHCHCGECRRLSGAAFTSWVNVARESFSIVEGAGQLQAFEPTVHLTRHFCRCCGSHVYTEDRRLPRIYGLPAGVLEGQPLPAPTAHYFFDHRAAWLGEWADGLPRFGGETGAQQGADQAAQ